MAYLKSKPKKAETVETADIKFDDAVVIGVPLFIRLLELAKEDIKQDADIHFIAEKLVDICQEEDVATMDDYKDILEYLDENKK
jgi:glutaredoxin 2